MSDADRVHLQEMLQAAEDIAGWVESVPLDQFIADRKLLAAVSMLLLVVGEGARQVSQDVKSRAPHLAWSDMTALRHRLAHGYMKADPAILWGSAAHKIPPLIVELRRLLDVLELEA